jgi:hypothetical protein
MRTHAKDVTIKVDPITYLYIKLVRGIVSGSFPMSQIAGSNTAITLTVLNSDAVMLPHDRVVVLLETKEIGAIAIEVGQPTIDSLRRALAAAENLLARTDKPRVSKSKPGGGLLAYVGDAIGLQSKR